MSFFERLRHWLQEEEFVSPEPPPLRNGRRYLFYQPYLLPKDLQEEHRLRFQHRLLYAQFGCHFFAPLQAKTVHTILDVGCGSGAWLMEMARLFPDALVRGIDSDARQGMRSFWTEHPRCRLLIGDVRAGTMYLTNTFDFTHMRFLVLALPAQSWPSVIEELVRVTVPSGWIELFEGGQQCEQAGPNMRQLLTWGQQFLEQRGFDLHVIEHLGELLQKAGVQNVTEQRLTIPVGSWGGRVGKRMGNDVLAITRTMQAPLCQALSLPPKQFEVMRRALPQEWNAYQTCYIFVEAHGQKAANEQKRKEDGNGPLAF